MLSILEIFVPFNEKALMSVSFIRQGSKNVVKAGCKSGFLNYSDLILQQCMLFLVTTPVTPDPSSYLDSDPLLLSSLLWWRLCRLRFLLEGVADRDWGITSAMAMVALTGKSCFRIFILQIIIFGILATHKQHTNRAVDCSRREPKKRSKILYIGSVRINKPKLKYSALSLVHTFL